MSLAEFPPPVESLAEVVSRLGDIPLERIPVQSIGCCTEADLVALSKGEKRLYELVEGVLVEKAMGYYESRLAACLIFELEGFVRRHKLGEILGADGAVRLFPGLVRIPDVSFISRERAPARGKGSDPIPDLAPDLAVEVRSSSNTDRELSRKVSEYFEAGCRLVWILDPIRAEVAVFKSPDDMTVLTRQQTLDGGIVLPGFQLSISDWLAAAEQPTA